MINEEQQKAPLEGLTAADAVIMLQTIARLVSLGRVGDHEIYPLGKTREALIKALKEATGVDYEVARARIAAEAEAAQRRAQAGQAQPSMETQAA